MSTSFAQIPTDTAALPYQVSEMVDLIVDGFEQPTALNQYVLDLQSEQGFPNISPNQIISPAEVVALKHWVKTHPKAIEQLLIDRKKYYDLYQSNQQ